MKQDEVEALADALAKKMRPADVPPTSRAGWISLLRSDPAQFDRLDAAGLVPRDAFDVRDGGK